MIRWRIGASLVLVAVAAATSSIAFAADSAPGSRQEEVARKGGAVMPFDLARTTHFFDDTRSGGVETVAAKDKRDRAQVALIQSHLRDEAKRFARGDFSDPAQVHGDDMPGLRTLADAGHELRVSYRALPDGARLTFVGANPRVITAVHEWFAAQRNDHAAHEHMHDMHR